MSIHCLFSFLSLVCSSPKHDGMTITYHTDSHTLRIPDPVLSACFAKRMLALQTILRTSPSTTQTGLLDSREEDDHSFNIVKMTSTVFMTSILSPKSCTKVLLNLHLLQPRPPSPPFLHQIHHLPQVYPSISMIVYLINSSITKGNAFNLRNNQCLQE